MSGCYASSPLPCIPGGEGCTCPLMVKDAMTKLHPSHQPHTNTSSGSPCQGSPQLSNTSPLVFWGWECAGISWHHQQEIPGHFLMSNNEPEVAKDISPWVTIMAWHQDSAVTEGLSDGRNTNEYPTSSTCQTMSLKWPKTSARGWQSWHDTKVQQLLKDCQMGETPTNVWPWMTISLEMIVCQHLTNLLQFPQMPVVGKPCIQWNWVTPPAYTCLRLINIS